MSVRNTTNEATSTNFRDDKDWLGRNDLVVNGEFPIGEVFVIPVVTPLYYRPQFLEEASQDRTTYGRMRVLKLSDPVIRTNRN